MLGELILSGGGDAIQTREMNRYYVRSLDEKKSVLYIPLAGDENYRSYDSCYEYTCSLFPNTKVTMWTDLREKTYDDMRSFSGVYMSGGSVNKLLAELVTTGFDTLLKKFFADGGIIYGQSAGAIVLGENMKIYEESEPKPTSLKELESLKLVGGYVIFCHYIKEHEEKVKAFVNENGVPILAIPDGTAVVASETSFHTIGEKPAYLYDRDGNKAIL
ncbi:Type 1 glutamine amidotransferase-like domain-containing protein [Guptibacillus algicola]|uniref:Type 1 glutamine amidotransferase-like domain-containing protein n=1 Tax=Guptibacillus algicola TaxID=225844 RepID=UPI001CD49AC1|nr:Type 1 glutamine amidotransferase-like domain-containing protein [Alkalihalobacillus algicola]MCA0987544.1 Type 1 glutamine amidotransferase-like domain-containing protein [Alkalihalobacillus algicola]